MTKHSTLQLVPSGTDEGPTAAQWRQLAELANAMDRPHTFRKGQIVRWKAGLKNRTIPAYNEAAIVREILETPVFDMCETAKCAGSANFGEPLNLVLAILDPDSDFVEFRYDGRRFEPADA
jgi:hypothetical protein